MICLLMRQPDSKCQCIQYWHLLARTPTFGKVGVQFFHSRTPYFKITAPPLATKTTGATTPIQKEINPLWLNPRWLRMHTISVAQTGSNKTTHCAVSCCVLHYRIFDLYCEWWCRIKLIHNYLKCLTRKKCYPNICLKDFSVRDQLMHRIHGYTYRWRWSYRETYCHSWHCWRSFIHFSLYTNWSCINNDLWNCEKCWWRQNTWLPVVWIKIHFHVTSFLVQV